MSLWFMQERTYNLQEFLISSLYEGENPVSRSGCFISLQTALIIYDAEARNVPTSGLDSLKNIEVSLPLMESTSIIVYKCMIFKFGAH